MGVHPAPDGLSRKKKQHKAAALARIHTWGDGTGTVSFTDRHSDPTSFPPGKPPITPPVKAALHPPINLLPVH